MQRTVLFSLRGPENLGVWKDFLHKDDELFQNLRLYIRVLNVSIKDDNSIVIVVHKYFGNISPIHAFYIIIHPDNNTIEYQQGSGSIILVSHIQESLKDKLVEYFTPIALGNKALGNFEFTDLENMNDPIPLNQNAGKRRKKTRRIRRN